MMELVVREHNIQKAIKKVKKNKGAPGIDGMKVSEIQGHFAQYFPEIKQKLLEGTYKPQAVKKSRNSQSKWEKACAWYTCRKRQSDTTSN